MNEPTPTNPTPTAVPWTPDMQTPPAPVVSPTPSPVPAPLQPPVQQTTAAQPAYPAAAQPAAQRQPVQAYAPQPQAQPAPRVQQHAPAAQQPRYAQPAAPQHMAPMQAPHGQAPHAHAQQPQVQHAQVQHAQGQPVHGQYAPPAAPQHFPQAAIPPLVAAHAQTAAQAVPAESKSLIAKLLKRAPKAELAPATNVQMPQASESLLNKNFALGAVTGLVIGAFVLPMLLNKIGIGNAPAPKQALATAPASVSNVAAPVPADAETFIDRAIADETP